MQFLRIESTDSMIIHIL